MGLVPNFPAITSPPRNALLTQINHCLLLDAKLILEELKPFLFDTISAIVASTKTTQGKELLQVLL
jgi:hypothetical protein